MKVNIQTNSKEISRRIGKKGKELSASVKKALLRTALTGLNIIQDRTNKSQSYKGAAFKPYSNAYAAFRSKNGRGNIPDLQFTGQMFSAMTVKANSKEAEIFFTRATESKKAAMVDKKRPFFGFNRSEENRLGQVFFRALK
mgnify:FL=1|tara:strand:- start:345 stop:767 length:423 start_codon:yes stop_codon:yes gene_type:complete